MKRAAILTVLYLLTVLPASAQPSWWHRHWKTVVGDGLILAATSIDAQSTCAGFRQGFVERAPLMRGTHNCGATVGLLAAGTATYFALNYGAHRMTYDDPNKYWRFAGTWTIPAIAVGFHGQAAAHNYLLQPGAPPAPPTSRP
jgi:hypothetical protein